MPIAFERRNLHNWTFLVLFGVTVYLFWLIAQPLWVPLFSGMLIAMGMLPLHQRFVRRFPRRETFSAAVLTGLLALAVLAVGGFFTLVVLGQLIDLARATSDQYRHGGSAEVLGERLQRILTSLGQNPEQIRQEVVSVTENVARNLGQTATRLVEASLSGILVVVLTAITGYFLLREGERLTEWLVGALPLPDDQVRELTRNFREVTQAMLLGTGVTALYEAITAFLGYWIAGVPRPLVWAALTGIASVVPAVGTALILAPIAVWLVLNGQTVGGAAVVVWGVLGMSGVANYVLRPRLLGSRMRMNDLLVFIALFGGVAAFGLLGIILGPIITALLVSLVHIYQRDYRPQVAVPDAALAEAA
jgi:predicted PurR-regulated permease PerM